MSCDCISYLQSKIAVAVDSHCICYAFANVLARLINGCGGLKLAMYCSRQIESSIKAKD